MFEKVTSELDKYKDTVGKNLHSLSTDSDINISVVYHDIFKDSLSMELEGTVFDFSDKIREDIDKLLKLSNKLLEESQLDYKNREIFLELECPTKALAEVKSNLYIGNREIEINEPLLDQMTRGIEEAKEIVRYFFEEEIPESIHDLYAELTGNPKHNEILENQKKFSTKRKRLTEYKEYANYEGTDETYLILKNKYSKYKDIDIEELMFNTYKIQEQMTVIDRLRKELESL